MAAKAGEIARETAKYLCESCKREQPVHVGVPIPDCPSCGSTSFQTGTLAAQQQHSAAPLAGFGSFP
ncbi:MAG: alpha helical protein [Alphaproteobacteria bacterium]|nr:alpha helical protein [Alphaproteobacteria bacterium]